MNVPLAWRTATHHKVRTVLALSAITFAVVLIFMQLALYETCEISATLVTDTLDFDILLTASQYYSLQQPGQFARGRVYQALAVPGVDSVSPVYMANLPWRNVVDGSRHVLLVMGVAPTDPAFASPEIRAQQAKLLRTGTALMDRRSLNNFQPIHQGLISEAGSHTLEIVGLFNNGGGMAAACVLVVSDRTFNELSFPLEQVNLGLVKLRPGADAATVVQALQRALPADVRVQTRTSFRERERRYWVDAKPVGMMFSSGVYIGILVGAVILYQVLANDITHRIREYATMKAIGYSDGQINLIVWKLGGVFALASYLVGLVLAIVLYWVIAEGTGIPLAMTMSRAAVVLGLSLLMMAVSGFLALRKLRGADPADLF